METESSSMIESLEKDSSIRCKEKDEEEESYDDAASPSLLATYSTASTIEVLPSSEKKGTNDSSRVVEKDSDTARSPSPSIIDIPVKKTNVKPVNNDGSDSSTSPPIQQNQLRERCMYGASCYRKNPAHKQQYSHPDDIDWGAGQRTPCPLGASCLKKDVRHLRDHSHPAAKKNKGKKRKRPAYQDTSTDEDDSTTAGSENEDKLSQPMNNILTTKRVRKTLQQQPQPEDVESDSEDSATAEVDPFLTDGSDNGGNSWNGSSDDGDTD